MNKKNNNMNVVWKRPDGFHSAHPSDYQVISIANKAKIWLHKKDKENYPFRVSSDWQGESQTKDLNNLVNLLAEDYKSWCLWFKEKIDSCKSDRVVEIIQKTAVWLDDMKSHSKGDSWEVDIIHSCLEEIKLH
jgi:hypothetical protein